MSARAMAPWCACRWRWCRPPQRRSSARRASSCSSPPQLRQRQRCVSWQSRGNSGSASRQLTPRRAGGGAGRAAVCRAAGAVLAVRRRAFRRRRLGGGVMAARRVGPRCERAVAAACVADRAPCDREVLRCAAQAATGACLAPRFRDFRSQAATRIAQPRTAPLLCARSRARRETADLLFLPVQWELTHAALTGLLREPWLRRAVSW